MAPGATHRFAVASTSQKDKRARTGGIAAEMGHGSGSGVCVRKERVKEGAEGEGRRRARDSGRGKGREKSQMLGGAEKSDDGGRASAHLVSLTRICRANLLQFPYVQT